MEETKPGCASPTGGGRTPAQSPGESQDEQGIRKEAVMNVVRVGALAPDFEANAWYEGKFQRLKLSDFAGKWVLLCFYPGDFTFV